MVYDYGFLSKDMLIKISTDFTIGIGFFFVRQKIKLPTDICDQYGNRTKPSSFFYFYSMLTEIYFTNITYPSKIVRWSPDSDEI